MQTQSNYKKTKMQVLKDKEIKMPAIPEILYAQAPLDSLLYRQ